MANVLLDADSNVVSLFAWPQPASVEIADDDPRLAAFVAASAPPARCLLWQLEAVCNAPPAALGFTPPTWAQVQALVAAENSAALTAFFNVGTNSIPANSKTLLALAAAAPTPLTAAQVAALIAAAAAITID